MAQPKGQVTVRSRYGKPAHPETLPSSQTDDISKIRFRHPAYSDSDNILISLAALDNGGVHYATAHAACAVLADFRYDGFFSLSSTGPAIDFSADEILTEPNYYFHVPRETNYDVVANFDSSIFPHGKMPPMWLSDDLKIPKALGLPRETSCNSIVLTRDVSCRVTNSTLGTEGAHLLPKAEELWYTKNSMFQYSAWEERGTTDDPRNTILLRSDAHTVFDAKRFIIVPKKRKWVTHVLYGTSQDELAQNFHNIHVQPLTDIAVEFIFARFVYTIHALSTFTLSGGKRALLVIKSGETRRERVEVTGLQYKTQLAPRSRVGSRTPSPSKRRRDDTPAGDADISNFDGMDDGDFRGRPRRRLSDENTSSPALSLECNEGCASTSSSLLTPTSDPSDSDSELSALQKPSPSHYLGIVSYQRVKL
ncbi:uncharacterized protein MAM_07328 [Metarhizium album ARSEF 1941]|uniref:HNH nuclease domain-containing protein n=1 Tax=Metarhizium album (strain ARSEF 1941) TaxID=1081103 RepID=A0A0B2WMJ1_METAS|nr:uncharacterized protein MAM_08149 [Metarhizium album ARSEF 1941]XP_040675975.1 uncharacterized protein MAM_07328 [Metarhizium album ARSEF 1941]KHN94020.1 hypothetical protein MAM_08149 [Metarhizium album ARSEF 1941]KHN94909.1 hypothetical protein MAM_07328 [Metarhizium album ARSEF 1941]